MGDNMNYANHIARLNLAWEDSDSGRHLPESEAYKFANFKGCKVFDKVLALGYVADVDTETGMLMVEYANNRRILGHGVDDTMLDFLDNPPDDDSE